MRRSQQPRRLDLSLASGRRVGRSEPSLREVSRAFQKSVESEYRRIEEEHTAGKQGGRECQKCMRLLI